jgi:Flp pilus assembly protein TadG
MSSPRLRRPGQRGQAIVELAIVAPVLLVLMLLAVDFGRLFFSFVAVQNASREATSYAAMHAADDPWDDTAYRASVSSTGVQETNVQAQGGAGTLTVSDPTCYVQDSSTTVDCHAASNYAAGIGNQVVVTATQPFDPSQSPDPTASPSPSPSPSPSQSLPPGATPTPSPSPSPTPVPMCTTPTFIGQFYNDLMTQAWIVAGFTGELKDQTDGGAITTQHPTAQTVVPCDSNGWVKDK